MKMKSRKGFTLIELMIVVVIVGILAAVVVPLLLSRIEQSKAAEGKGIASQVATVLRAYVAENGAGSYSLATMGFKTAELDGKYYDQAHIGGTTGGTGNITVTETNGALTYNIYVAPRAGLTGVPEVHLSCAANLTTITP
jgi:type IV pilus assembly protein PilA